MTDSNSITTFNFFGKISVSQLFCVRLNSFFDSEIDQTFLYRAMRFLLKNNKISVSSSRNTKIYFEFFPFLSSSQLHHSNQELHSTTGTTCFWSQNRDFFKWNSNHQIHHVELYRLICFPSGLDSIFIAQGEESQTRILSDPIGYPKQSGNFRQESDNFRQDPVGNCSFP